jgi:hypothetical protein
MARQLKSSRRPLVPSIQAISDPDRLVIDLPNARLETQKQKRISVQADQISSLRADQLQENPPVARVVVDLLAPRPTPGMLREIAWSCSLGKKS